MIPPRTRRDAVVDTLHGIAVPDPYRWLEDGNDPEVQQWVAEQNRLTRSALDASPSRAVWHERLVALMGLAVVQAVQVRGDRLILLEREAGEQQARLTVRSVANPSGESMVLVDPSSDTTDGAAAIDWYFASPDGELVAYGVSEGGTENSVLRVVAAVDSRVLSDEIPNCRACNVAWEPDGSGFFYTRYPEGDEYHRTVYHHTLGDASADDPVVWAEHETPEVWPGVELSPDGRYLVVSAMAGWSRHDQHVLDRTTGTWRDLIVGVDAISDFSFADDKTLIGMTTLNAPMGRIVSVDLADPDVGHSAWTTVVPERTVVMGSPVPIADGFYISVAEMGVDSIEHWTMDGRHNTEIEGVGVSSVVQISADRSVGRAFAIVTGFDSPAAVYSLEHDHRADRIHPGGSGGSMPSLIPDLIPDLEVSQVEYPSFDGTLIGLFLIHRSDVSIDASTPTILNGYGGFAISETPMWSPTIAAWCEAGGLYAIAGLRGGFEHGEEWHRAGKRANKQNVFGDFHAAADWLVTTGRTSRDRLAIAGGSNGGLLVGAALTQRPDLCRAVWCAVPLLDMIRFPQFLIARLWTEEYGDPDVAEEFGWLHAYSPYHHVVEGERYPAVLLTTAEGDTRVDALHARKMAAMLQSAAADPESRPVLLHQEGRAGHGVGKPVGKRAAEQADVLAFLSWQLEGMQ
jgi:prolyl oligopeptidase